MIKSVQICFDGFNTIKDVPLTQGQMALGTRVAGWELRLETCCLLLGAVFASRHGSKTLRSKKT